MKTTPATRDNEARLPTARSSGPQERSVLAILRSVMPRRPLRMHELERVAELQANRLLELAGLNGPAVPSQIISDLPRIRVVSVVDLPVSGTAQWVGGQWVLSLNAGEHETRQRFSLAHEFKHVIDHPLRDVIYSGGPATPAQQAERIADYFAACLLMPKKWVVRAWGQGTQRLSALSEQFEVSPRAMQVRLWQLGLTEPTPRCSPSVCRTSADEQRLLHEDSGDRGRSRRLGVQRALRLADGRPRCWVVPPPGRLGRDCRATRPAG